MQKLQNQQIKFDYQLTKIFNTFKTLKKIFIKTRCFVNQQLVYQVYL